MNFFKEIIEELQRLGNHGNKSQSDAIDPATIALIIQIVIALLPVIIAIGKEIIPILVKYIPIILEKINGKPETLQAVVVKFIPKIMEEYQLAA